MRTVMTTTMGLMVGMLAAAGCTVVAADDDAGTGGGGGTASVGGNGSGGDTQGGENAGGSSTSSGGGPAGWTHSTHPCVGNRTDALLIEDQAAWVGCGSTTVGFGLYRSEDGGASWAAPTTTPSGALDEFRVLDVSRGGDGLLYVAGTGPGGAMVVALDTASSPMAVTEILNAGPTVNESFIVGTFRLRSDGSALAESLNGTGMLYRPNAEVGPDAFGDGWQDASNWANGGTASFQLLDMETHEGGFYGCGSTIADTPKLFVPPTSTTAEPYEMTVLELDTFQGEMWSLDVAPSGLVVVGGVDQDAGQGMVFVGDPEGTLAPFDLGSVLPDASTWIRGVCTDGTRVVAVGEFSTTSDPLLFTSTDAGATWEQETPDAATAALSECVVLPDGSFVVAGGDGYFGTFRP